VARDGQLARDLRAGLEQEQEVKTNSRKKREAVHPLDERWFGKAIRVHVREFSCVLAIVMLAIAGWLLWRGATVATPLGLWFAASVLVVLGYRAPALLKPVWESWMKLAHYLGIVVTFLILTFTWFLVTLPIAMILKLIGKKVMDTSFGAPVESYWEEREESESDFKLLSRQY